MGSAATLASLSDVDYTADCCSGAGDQTCCLLLMETCFCVAVKHSGTGDKF